LYFQAAIVQFHHFTRLAFVFLSAFALALEPAQSADTAKRPRVALVIGNSRYETAVGPLRNTVNDAKAMGKALSNLGFTVIEKHNVTRDELMTALLQFRTKLSGAEVGLFYFAGHGISVAGSNYLLPIKSGYNPGETAGADLRLLAETKLFNAEQAVAEMNSSGVSCNLVILDACRSTPVTRNPATRDAISAGGLVEMNPPAGSLVAFATDAGHAAADGAGVNGLYTEELIKNLLTPGLTIEQVFKRTRAGVMERSSGAQIPAEYSRLVGDDIFLAGRKPPEPAEPSALKALLVPIPALTDISKLAATGKTKECLEALQYYARVHGAGSYSAAPLATLLDQVKQRLADPKSAAQNADQSLEDCTHILSVLSACLPPNDIHQTTLQAKAYNRQGDALLLLNQPDEALTALNSAAGLDPGDGYILYNRGRAYLALDRKDEAKADFTAASGPRFKKSGARKLAREALAAMK